MNFKVTATPNGKGKVKITVTKPDGESFVHIEKCKEGRFTHMAVVHWAITQNSIDRHIKRMKRDTVAHVVEKTKADLENYIGKTGWEIQMATSKENAMKKTSASNWFDSVGVDVFEVEAA